MIGGIVRRSRELVGPAAETMLANYHLDLAFIGVDGLSGEGCTTYDEMEATTDAAFLQQARRRVVVADSSKIGRVTFARISPLTGIDRPGHRPAAPRRTPWTPSVTPASRSSPSDQAWRTSNPFRALRPACTWAQARQARRA